MYVVINILDKCINKKGQIIWNDLITKLEDSVTNLRLLYILRHINDIIGILVGLTCIEIYTSEADIRAYV